MSIEKLPLLQLYSNASHACVCGPAPCTPAWRISRPAEGRARCTDPNFPNQIKKSRPKARRREGALVESSAADQRPGLQSPMRRLVGSSARRTCPPAGRQPGHEVGCRGYTGVDTRASTVLDPGPPSSSSSVSEKGAGNSTRERGSTPRGAPCATVATRPIVQSWRTRPYRCPFGPDRAAQRVVPYRVLFQFRDCFALSRYRPSVPFHHAQHVTTCYCRRRKFVSFT